MWTRTFSSHYLLFGDDWTASPQSPKELQTTSMRETNGSSWVCARSGLHCTWLFLRNNEICIRGWDINHVFTVRIQECSEHCVCVHIPLHQPFTSASAHCPLGDAESLFIYNLQPVLVWNHHRGGNNPDDLYTQESFKVMPVNLRFVMMLTL